MIKVLFVCHGNICRSPMAEFIFKDFLKKRGEENEFLVLSAATSSEELGNPVYPPARKELFKHGITCEGKYAVQLKKSDYETYDHILCMDDWNMKNISRILGCDGKEKVGKLLDFCGGGEVADPWYTGNFERTYEDLEKGITAFYEFLKKNK